MKSEIQNRMDAVWRDFDNLEKRIKAEGMIMRIGTDNLYRLLKELESSINKIDVAAMPNISR